MATPLRTYSLQRDVHDPRDRKFAYRPKPQHLAKPLPPKVDLRDNCGSVLDQGGSGTCTAHAVTGAFVYLRRLHRARPVKLSPRFIFYNELEMTGQLGPRFSVHLRDALKAVAARGVCPEATWPYRDNLHMLNRKPPKHAFHAAKARKVISYHRILDKSVPRKVLLQHLKHCLAEGYPFIFGFNTYASFEPGKWKGGTMPIPNVKTEAPKGGHAVMAIGYDDKRQAFLIRNSWGPKWGTNGNFYMPYKLITDPKFTHDFWTVRGITG
jgi:C1A family cysteine protease